MDPTVYFTGTGTLFMFSLGVAKYLKEHYHWNKATVLTVSGGGVASSALLCLPPEQFDYLAVELAKMIERLPKGIQRTLHAGEFYQQTLKKIVTPAALPFLRERLLIKTTVLPCIKQRIYEGPYQTVDEVVGKLCASAYIPFVFFLRPPYPNHLNEVDGALGAGEWKKYAWPKTLVVGPSFTGNEDVWYRENDWWDEMRLPSYFEQLNLYHLGYRRAHEMREQIAAKLGPPLR